MEKGDRVSTERRLGGLAHRDLSMKQATFYCDSSFRSDGIATPFAKKIPESCLRRSRSERERRATMDAIWFLLGELSMAGKFLEPDGGPFEARLSQPHFRSCAGRPKSNHSTRKAKILALLLPDTSELAATRWVTRPRSETSNHGADLAKLNPANSFCFNAFSICYTVRLNMSLTQRRLPFCLGWQQL